MALPVLSHNMCLLEVKENSRSGTHQPTVNGSFVLIKSLLPDSTNWRNGVSKHHWLSNWLMHWRILRITLFIKCIIRPILLLLLLFHYLFSQHFLPGTSPLEPRWTPPHTLRLQVSEYSIFRTTCDVPITAFCSESTECLPGVAYKFLFKAFVSTTVAPVITGVIIQSMIHICCICLH